jgi:Uma2 family endonuclease
MSILDPRTPSQSVLEPEVIQRVEGLPTEDDLPCSDGEPMETEHHIEQMFILIKSLKYYWKNSKRYYVGGNMFLHYELHSKKKFRGPDFFLVLDVDNRRRKSWVVWQEGNRYPDVIIELLSDTTKREDKVKKKNLYEKVFHTREYYLYDPLSQEFYGYHMQDGRYKKVKPDKEKKIYSLVTGLYLIVHGEWLRWMTPEEDILPMPDELAELVERAEQQRELERQRAEQEKQRAERAERLLEEYRRRLGNSEEAP